MLLLVHIGSVDALDVFMLHVRRRCMDQHAQEPLLGHRRPSLKRLKDLTVYYVRKADSKIPFKNRCLRNIALCVLLFPWSAVLMLAGAQWSRTMGQTSEPKSAYNYDPNCFAWRETAYCHPYGCVLAAGKRMHCSRGC